MRDIYLTVRETTRVTYRMEVHDDFDMDIDKAWDIFCDQPEWPVVEKEVVDDFPVSVENPSMTRRR